MHSRIKVLIDELSECLGDKKVIQLFEGILEEYKKHSKKNKEETFELINDFLIKEVQEFNSVLEKQSECDHGIIFDEDDARSGMTSMLVRAKYPRLNGECPKGCGYNGIGYASYAHYLYGDW